MNKRTIAKVMGWVLGLVVLLEVAYVVAAKVALAKLPQLASYDALQMTYSSAGSWIPGRAWVRDFVVSGHDYNMQFEVRVKEAQVKIDLLALLSQHFHATQAITSGVEFRMRHNVEQLAGQERRLAAFPTIRGYDKPPVYPGPDPEPGPPKDAWLIEMENIHAQVDDLWVVEYHYAGKGSAKGGFSLDPGRAFHLQPSEFVFEGGEVTVGDVTASRVTTGVLKTEMHLADIQAIQGFDFVDDTKMDLDLSLHDGQLAFLDVYSGLPLKRVGGEHDIDVRLLSEGRKLHAGTLLEANFGNLNVATEDASFTGDAVVEVGAKQAAEPSVVHLLPLNVKLKNASLALDGNRSKRFVATVASTSTKWLNAPGASALQTTVDVSITPGDALLEVALGKTPAAITDAFLDLPRLVTRVAVYLTADRSRVELLDLDAGDLKASGVWQDRASGGVGDFTVRTSLVDIGVEMGRDGVSWETR